MVSARLSRLLVVLTLGLITLGGVVHNTESSLACPDWPLCFGQVFPKMQGGVAIEHSHRLVAALVGLLSIVLAVALHRRRRDDPAAAHLGWTALALVVAQGLLGGITVLLRLPTLVSTAHLGTALLYFCTMVRLALHLAGSAAREPAATVGADGLESVGPREPAAVTAAGTAGVPAALGEARRWITAALVCVYAQTLLGAFVRHTGSGAAAGLGPGAAWLARDLERGVSTLWPADGPGRLNMLHRLAALLVLAVVLTGAGRVVRAARPGRRERSLAIAAVLLVALQASLGVASIWTYLSVTAVTLHLSVATLLLGVLLALRLELPGVAHATVVAGGVRALRRAGPAATGATTAGATTAGAAAVGAGAAVAAARPLPATGALRVLADLVALTKPRLLMLVVFTSGAGLVLAPGTVTLRSGATAIALTALIVAAGTTLNMHLERDLDALMERTRERPLPAGRLRPAVALAMGILLACVSVPLLFLFVNPLTAVLGTLAFALYVGAYTPMKRRSAASVYIGAIPGATPIVMGWTAATGHLDPGALSLFAILFLWQLPHFMAISLYRKSEYAAAGIRILPLVVGERATRWHAVAAALLLTVATLVPAALGLASRPYLAVAALLALATLIGSVHVLRERAELSWARRYFLGSLVYLPVLLGTLVIGAL